MLASVHVDFVARMGSGGRRYRQPMVIDKVEVMGLRPLLDRTMWEQLDKYSWAMMKVWIMMRKRKMGMTKAHVESDSERWWCFHD